jgi:hypothetical protein
VPINQDALWCKAQLIINFCSIKAKLTASCKHASGRCSVDAPPAVGRTGALKRTARRGRSASSGVNFAMRGATMTLLTFALSEDKAVHLLAFVLEVYCHMCWLLLPVQAGGERGQGE